MTERDIQNILYRHLKKRGHTMITPNAKHVFHGWEADMISVTKAGYTNEFEIKISKADFYADFKKPNNKHLSLKERRAEIPSYFWYVTTGFTIADDGVPEYAGNIRITKRLCEPGYWITILKPAPRLTKETITTKQLMSLYRVVWNKLWLERMRDNG